MAIFRVHMTDADGDDFAVSVNSETPTDAAKIAVKRNPGCIVRKTKLDRQK